MLSSGDHVIELRLDEYQASGVFEGLGVMIGSELGTTEERAGLLDCSGVPAVGSHDLGERVSLVRLVLTAPSKIALASGREVGALEFPPFQVMRPRREL